jgi:putative CocE/NonD family hydrolase
VNTCAKFTANFTHGDSDLRELQRRRPMGLRRCTTLIAALLGLAIAPAVARSQAPRFQYGGTNTMIDMRDGISLSTFIFAPRGAVGPFPILLFRTATPVTESSAKVIRGPLADDGYIFVFQNVRGRGKSGGTYVPQRQARDAKHRNDGRATDEATDAYDSIDWLIKNVPNNTGKVGMLSTSFDGWIAMMALTDPHPALKAISPQASAADPWLTDQTTAPGPRRTYVLDITGTPTNRDESQFTFDSYDTYDRFLRMAGSGSGGVRAMRSEIAPWSDASGRLDYRSFWLPPTLPIPMVTVPTLHVAGFAEEDDPTGPLAMYSQLEKVDRAGQNFLVIGPWNNEGWFSGDANRGGRAGYESAASRFFRDSIQAPFFATYLKGRTMATRPEALIFEIGSNQWRPFEAWPPKLGVNTRSLYLASGGRLIFDRPPAPGDGPEFVSFVADNPAKPRPRRAQQQRVAQMVDPRNSNWYAWLTRDSRFIEARVDYLSWKTEPLREDVTIAGEVLANIFASANAPEAEWIVELIDIYPDDTPGDVRGQPFAYMVSNEVFHARFDADLDNTFGRSRPIAGRYSLSAPSYRFNRGHRIMLQIESTWFPLVDRGPQEFLSMIFGSKAESMQGSHRVYHSPQLPSALILPVLSSTLP